jgi:hypothetical protein
MYPMHGAVISPLASSECLVPKSRYVHVSDDTCSALTSA